MNDETSVDPEGTAATEVEPRDELTKLVRRDQYLLCDPEELVEFDWSLYLDVPAD